MTRYLEHQIPTGQGDCLRMAEQLQSNTIGAMVLPLITYDPSRHLGGNQLAEGTRFLADRLAGRMIDLSMAHGEAALMAPATLDNAVDPLARFREHMYTTIGHPDRQQRFYGELPMLGTTGISMSGDRRVYSHAVASLVDWQNDHLITIAKDPWVDHRLPDGWMIIKHELTGRRTYRESISQVEADESAVTLFAFSPTEYSSQKGVQSPHYYTVYTTEDYRADAVILSSRAGQSGRSCLVFDAYLSDDVGVLHQSIRSTLARRGLTLDYLYGDFSTPQHAHAA